MQSPTTRKILSATDRSLTMASWHPQAEATLKTVLMRCQPPALEGGGWFQKFQVELFNKCQPHERQLLNKFMAQTLAAKVKAYYESAGKENGEFSFFFRKLFDFERVGGEQVAVLVLSTSISRCSKRRI